MTVRVSVDITKAVEGLHDLQKSQLPFAVSKTLNTLAYGAQKQVRQDIDAPGSRFTLRNSFTQRSIKVEPSRANSNPIEAKVYTDPRAGYLALQESGGERVPINGRQHLATPTKFLFDLIGGYNRIIPQAFRPKSLLEYADAQGKVRSVRNRKGVFVPATGPVRGYRFFVVRVASGNYAIVGRPEGEGREIVPFYYLVDERLIQQRFGLEKDVRAYVAANYEAVWREVWRDINLKGIRLKL